MAMRSVLVLLALVVSMALGHNWLESPPSRNGNTDSTAKPCPAGTPTVVRAFAGEQLPITWTDNHGGAHYIHLVPAAQEATLEDQVAANAVGGPYNGITSATYTVPAVQPGLYVMQYRWAQYRNCVDLNILATPPSGAVEIEGEAGIFMLENGGGRFDANTGILTCESGYKESEGTCVKSGMHPAGAFFLTLFVLLVVGVIVFVALVFAHRKNVLPDVIDRPVGKVDGGMKSAWNKVTGRSSGHAAPASNIGMQSNVLPTTAPAQHYAPPPTGPAPAPTRAAPLRPTRV